MPGVRRHENPHRTASAVTRSQLEPYTEWCVYRQRWRPWGARLVSVHTSHTEAYRVASKHAAAGRKVWIAELRHGRMEQIDPPKGKG